MPTQKPWYLSRTIWASLVVIASALAGAFGFAVDVEDSEPLADAILQAVTAIAGVVAIIGRLAAKARIG